MKPPPKMSEEEEKLWAQFDITELTHRRMQKIRGLTTRTPEQNRLLHEYDQAEQQMAKDPKQVFKEAHEALDRGTSLLCRLIRGQHLRETYRADDGTLVFDGDSALECLISRTHHLNSQLLRLAKAGREAACSHLFYEGKRFAKAFMQLAQARPENFRNSAESSLTMPSLRTTDPGYTADAEAIARTIHLGRTHPVSGVRDQRDRLGSLCHVLVGELLTSIHQAREDFERHRGTASYLQVSADEYIKSTHYPDLYEHVMACSRLPEWRHDPVAWWKMRVLPMVKEEFLKLTREPQRNMALWNELKRVGETQQESLNDMRRSLEKNCKNKFDQFVRASRKTAHETAAHGHPR